MNSPHPLVIPSITLRPMTASDHDLDSALRLSQGTGWPYRRDDWRIALDLGEGILAEADGAVIASALWWPYSEAFATSGIIIVSPTMQGQGLGRTLMAHVLEAAGGRAILLNSTAEGHQLYKKFGFKDIGTVYQHQAQTRALAGPSPSDNDTPVRAARAADLMGIQRMDGRAFGVERAKLIDAFTRIGTAAVIERDGELQGFAMCRPFGRGKAIGPVIARTDGDARLLIGHFLAENAGQFLRVDISGDSGLGDWLTLQGLPDVGSVTTMIRGPRPQISGQERTYALASQSFG